MVIPKTLIVTAWSPTKTHCFARYAFGINEQLRVANTELFITSTVAKSKFASIVGSMASAEKYALGAGFTHYLNVEADKVLPRYLLQNGLERGKDVLLFNDKGAPWSGCTGLERLTFQTLIEANKGWGVMLVTTPVLEKATLRHAYVGDFISPDRAWFKRVLQLGFEVWRDNDTHVTTLDPPAEGPEGSFFPTDETHVTLE